MRERTPSADDTPKRAPPAPPGEADVAVRKATDVASAAAYGASKMVASTHSLDDLGVSHVASANQNHHHHHHPQQPQQIIDKHHQHGHHYGKSAHQSAQDKRSRLSNVINNLRKKVPPESTKSDSSNIKEEDGRNSVERNLETLEKYVMTVLNGVIEDEDKSSGKKEQEPERTITKDPVSMPLEIIATKDAKVSSGTAIVAAPSREEDSTFPAPEVLCEPFEANESKLDAAVPSTDEAGSKEDGKMKENEKKKDDRDASETKVSNPSCTTSGEKDVVYFCDSQTVRSPKDETDESPRSLGAIILDRLNDRHQDQPSNFEVKKDSADSELRTVCKELLNDLLSDIIQAMDAPSQASLENESELNSDGSMQSLHCSLPLDKVASVLPSCQTPSSPPPETANVSTTIVQANSSKVTSSFQNVDKRSAKSQMKPASPTVRHLCLYCDRKFLSISLRQRHTERVHQASGGRRSERNSRKPTQQNCQYCVDKCSDNLEGLFQHMVGSHSDKYHGCLQCSTRYLTRDALTSHIHEIHNHVTVQMEKLKEPIVSTVKEAKSPNEAVISTKEEPSCAVVKQSPARDQPSNPGSPEFDNSFYSNVSCNIRENLLHHIDGKIQADSSSVTSLSSSSPAANSSATTLENSNSSSKTPQYQLPIDISLTAVTPVYNKDYPMAPEDYENSSEHAGKPGKTCNRTHPRRVSFEKYNFPRKYDGKEQWSCSIKDLSKFDISTQLTLRKKQRFIKECTTLNRLDEITSLSNIDQRTEDYKTSVNDLNVEKLENKVVTSGESADSGVESVQSGEVVNSGDGSESDKKDNSDEHVNESSTTNSMKTEPTVFSCEFENFMRLKKWNQGSNNKKNHKVVYTELTGEWSRPRVYICGACAERYVTMKELEEHKSTSHPNVWCMHFEFSGDQRELYKHLVFLPGRSASPTPSMKTRQQTINSQPPERICTKCSKSCGSLAELHRHILECGGDQAWLLGLFGNGKKKCKWRPFGSRSRRRRQRGMKRNIQNSQTPRNVTPRERPQPTGPRVRPSDRESIQKMLANLPAKRATRKVLQENAARSQGRLRNAQSRSGAADNQASRIVKSKAALRNKLLKNAKSYQRKKNLREGKQQENEAGARAEEARTSGQNENSKPHSAGVGRPRKILRNARVLSKKKNITAKESAVKHVEQPKRTIKLRSAIIADDNAPLDVGRRKISAKASGRDASSKPEESDEFSEFSMGKNKKKRKRSVESLASLKAKLQLRTNDGKFARGEKKSQSTPVPLDVKSIKIGRRPVNDPVRLLTRSKLRAAAKMAWKEHTKISRRITRLRSLDGEKASMSQNFTESTSNFANKDEGAEKVTAEVAKSKVAKNNSRNSSLSRRSLDGNVETDKNSEKSTDKIADGKIDQPLPIVRRGGRPKKEVAEVKVDENSTYKQQSESTLELKTRSQKMLSSSVAPAAKLEPKTRRSIATKENFAKDAATELPKKNSKSTETSTPSPSYTAKEDKERLGLTTRSNSRAKKEGAKEKHEIVVLDNNLKKLFNYKETSEKKPLKRAQKDALDKKAEKVEEIEVQTDVSFPSSKKEKTTVGLRKSPRNKESDETDAKVFEKIEISSKFVKVNEKKDAAVNVSVEIKESIECAEKIENKEEIIEAPVKKTVPGKRRGRVKRIVENVEEPKTSETPQSNDVIAVKQVELTIDKIEKEESVPEPTVVDAKNDSLSKINNSSTPHNLSLEHLQQESSNSNMDSGKENSMETIINMSKLRVVRPKKSRGLRKDNKATTTKRSLNSVIGILTEGVNVPVESQDPIVLTVQTSVDMDSSNSENASQNNDQPIAEISSSSSIAISSKTAEICNTNTNLDIPVSVDSNKKDDEMIIEETKSEEQTNLKIVTHESHKETMKVSNTSASDQINNKDLNASSAVITESPPNDIILDLSRRKPKGKGSFLEKIVSKIAKQKDVSLEGDSVCLSFESHKKTENIEKTNIQENNSTKITKEIKVENLLNKELNVKLNESTTINIVNNSENVLMNENIEKCVINEFSNNDKINDIHVAGQTLIKSLQIERVIKKSESKIDEKDNEVLNGTMEQIRCENINNLDLKLPIVNEETKEENGKIDVSQLQKSKKRSLETNSPKKNKKKPVNTESADEEDNKEELCLADIMKLIERPKLNETQNDADAEQEIVRPGKRKTPDDDTDFNHSNTNVENITFDSSNSKIDKEITKKSKRKSGPKKNKCQNSQLVNESNALKEVTANDESDLVAAKLSENNSEIKRNNDKSEIIEKDKEVSQITKENILQLEKENNENGNESFTTKKLIEETNLLDNLPEENILSKDADKTEKIVKRRKKASKKDSENLEEAELNEKLPIAFDESFKVPESIEVTKSTKKRLTRKKYNVKNSSDQELEKDESDIDDKLPIDDKLESSSDNCDQYSSMSESEEKWIPKRTFSRRTTRNSKIGNSDETFNNTKESDDSDVSSANEMEYSRRKRSQRKKSMIDNNRDISVNSVNSTDESVPSRENKSEMNQTLNKLEKENSSLAKESSESFNENDTLAEREIKNSNTPETKETKIVQENINYSEEENKNKLSIVQPITINKEDEKQVFSETILQNDKVSAVQYNLDNTTNSERILELDKCDDQLFDLSESHMNSFEDSNDTFDKQSTIYQEISASELDESINLELQTPKKRLAGNFAIVNKSGKILIVEKKKKLTKEAAKFFCNVCATSFTRKSSLKKHNSSQSHILQVTMTNEKDTMKENQEIAKTLMEPMNLVKDKIEIACNEHEEIEKEEEQEEIIEKVEKEKKDEQEDVKEDEKENEKEDRKENKNENEKDDQTEKAALKLTKDLENISIEQNESILEKEILIRPFNINIHENAAYVTESTNTTSLIIPEPIFCHKSPEEQLEDEMLDEEICKITENMSHDEYVLTDHVSPVTPEAASTPMKKVDVSIQEFEDFIDETDNEVRALLKKKKKEKKKKNLADDDEHLDLNTPMPTIIPLEDFEMKKQSVNILNEDNVLSTEKNNDVDLPLNKSKITEEVDKSLEEITELQTVKSKKEHKSKNNIEKVNIINENRRTNRNRNQNINQVITDNSLENSRPKRNQLRPSYKEDDFDIIDSPEENIEENQESLTKRDRINDSIEIEQVDIKKDGSSKKLKETLKTKRDKSNLSSTETELSDIEKNVSTEKSKGRKNQNKKKILDTSNKKDNSEILTTEKSDEKSINENEETKDSNIKQSNLQNSIDEKSEIVESEVKNKSDIKTLTSEEQFLVPVKKKRGRKPKKLLIQNEVTVNQENISIANNVAFIHESKFEKKDLQNFEELVSTNQKQEKSKKNQNKRKKRNGDIDNSKDTFDDKLQVEISENSAIEIKKGEKNENSKPNILLESSFESLKNTTNKIEITIPTLPVKTKNLSEKIDNSSEFLTNKNADDTQQHMVFPNLNTDNFKTFEDVKNDLTASMLSGFDSDENSLDTNISVDIQKLLNDPEMTTEIAKQSNEDSKDTEALNTVDNVDVINIKAPKISLPEDVIHDAGAKDKITIESKNEDDAKKATINSKSINKKSPKTTKFVEEKKPKRRGRKPKNNANKIINEASILSDESEGDTDKQDDKIQKSKNKIVKSVFGRVFGGEKIDKVKEVLDDWQSRSENNSSDSDAEKLRKNSRSRTKKNLRNSGDLKKSSETSGRSRQSKKRAEELISRAFNDDSPIPDREDRAAKNQRLSRRNQVKSASPSKEKVDNEELSQNDDSQNKEIEAKQTATKPKKGRKRKDLESSTADLKQVKYQSNDEDEEEIVDKSEESLVSDAMLERGEMVQPTELENTDNADDDDDDPEEHNGRMTPVYIRNTSEDEDTLRSSSSSENENENENENEKREKEEEEKKVKKSKKKKGRRSSTKVFSSEKVVIRSPQALRESTDGLIEMVTIAPTDAVEDNALDLEMTAVEKGSPDKAPRQPTKVLNFDEELFVECCSRLKATSEKELRGAKKIKLDHSADQVAGAISTGSHHHRKDEQSSGCKGTKDRWRDVESQNSLGSLLESVNQLLGEEYNSREKEYNMNVTKRARGHHHYHHHHHHHHNRHNNVSGRSSRSASPEERPLRRLSHDEEDDNLGYDDSLDVAFEHNNKLRDKIQQRMRESENLIAHSFGHKNSSPAPATEATSTDYDNCDYGANVRAHSKAKINNGLGGLLDKALSNLLHNNEKHDHNGSTPMKLLAELACARAPTSTTPTVLEKYSKSSPTHKKKDASLDEQNSQIEQHNPDAKTVPSKKTKNPIKELFERKKELHEKKQIEKLKISTIKSSEKLKKLKKLKNVQHNHSLIRTSQYHGGMAERKKRRDGGHVKKDQSLQSKNKIKDVYEFDEEESVSEPGFTSVLSYRVKNDGPKELNMSALLSKTIGDALSNGKPINAISENLENMVERKFKDIEKFSPKTKTSGKNLQIDERQIHQNVIGPMDEFIERRQKSKRSSGEYNTSKHSNKFKKKSGKGGKKKSRNAWYEDDSSDEFVTKLKADDIGVGISKSQRTCSKGKQNLFAEMSSTSSESELEGEMKAENEENFDDKKLSSEPPLNFENHELEESKNKEDLANEESRNIESQEEDWTSRINNAIDTKSNSPILDLENNKKSESELSDHPLVIDENLKETTDEQRTNSDDETEERTFELDDLYREDSSIVDSDREELPASAEDKSNSVPKISESATPTLSAAEEKPMSDKYISLEDALDLLDQPQEESSLSSTKKIKSFITNEQATPEIFEKNERREIDDSQDDEEETVLEDLPEKLSSNEKPQHESENLPLHVFLSRKVQESKKRKQQQLKKLKEEQERMLLELQPTRRQRKCAIGKQGLLAEISSSDEELSTSYNKRSGDKIDKYEKVRNKQKQRESKEKRKERYIEKKHEQMIAKEQKAIEEAIMRELEEKRQSAASEGSGSEKDEKKPVKPEEIVAENLEKTMTNKHCKTSPKKHVHKQKNHETVDGIDDETITNTVKRPKSMSRMTTDTENEELNTSAEIMPPKKKRAPTKSSPQKNKKAQKPDVKTPSGGKRTKTTNGAGQRRSKSRPTSLNRNKDLQPRSLSSKRESDLDGDEELKAARSWNRVDEGVGVAIGRRKRAAANQLYYWSSSSEDEEEAVVPSSASTTQPTGATDGQEAQEDDRQEQHGWIVGDSHKKMITMLAMEKQMKEKRRRSENDEQSPSGSVGGKGKSKKHRNSTS